MVAGKLVERVHVDALSLNPYLLLVDILESDNILALFIYFVLRLSVKNVQEEQNVEIFHCQKCIKIALKLNDYSEEISCDWIE